MAQTQLLKRRIRSVGNTRQITKAMELVSASKMRRAQGAVLSSRPYISAARYIIRKLSAVVDSEHHPYFMERPTFSELIVIISSDRGLAGAYNSNVVRMTTERLNRNVNQGIANHVIAIGQKAVQYASQIPNITLEGVYTMLPTEPSSLDIRPIIETATRLFLNQTIDRVVIIATEFHSSLHQEVVARQILPIIASPDLLSTSHASHIDFEPSAEEVFDQMLPRFVEAELYQLLLEANASEHSMRMLAMKNASDNAEELVSDLTQHYNSARQAAITQELAEISSGAEAIQQ